VDGVRVSRLLIWSGPVFAVLFAILAVASGDAPGVNKSPAEINKYFDDHSGMLLASVFLSPLAIALLIGFTAAVRTRASESGRSAVGPAIMMAGAVVWSAGLLLGSMITLAQVDASDDKHNEATHALNDLSGASWVPLIAGIAVFLIGAGITALASRLLPAWLGWLALALGVISLAGPGGFVGFFGAPLWLLVGGTLLGLRDRGAVTEPLTQPVTERAAV
jgi:MFS family permease